MLERRFRRILAQGSLVRKTGVLLGASQLWPERFCLPPAPPPPQHYGSLGLNTRLRWPGMSTEEPGKAGPEMPQRERAYDNRRGALDYFSQKNPFLLSRRGNEVGEG